MPDPIDVTLVESAAVFFHLLGSLIVIPSDCSYERSPSRLAGSSRQGGCFLDTSPWSPGVHQIPAVVVLGANPLAPAQRRFLVLSPLFLSWTTKSLGENQLNFLYRAPPASEESTARSRWLRRAGRGGLLLERTSYPGSTSYTSAPWSQLRHRGR